jgi:hypothetical protein
MQRLRTRVAAEAQLLCAMLRKHALPLRQSRTPRVAASAKLALAYRGVFSPYASVQELRAAIDRAPKGRTGRLTTIDELAALSDEQLELLLPLCELLFAGEAPPAMKLGDVVPLPKDLERVRPITLLEPLLKVEDSTVSVRILGVTQDSGLLHPNSFGFVTGGSSDKAVAVTDAVYGV